MNIKVFALAAASMVASAVSAAPISFNITWSGAEYGNTASATGHLTVDDSFFNTGGGFQNTSSSDPRISAFDVSIHQSDGSTNTYSLSDFSNFYIYNNGTLDLSQELIGQNVGNGCLFGDRNGCSGDFNAFTNDGQPQGTYFFRLTSFADNVAVTSMTAADVPEPAMLGLFGMGAIGLGLARRRKA